MNTWLLYGVFVGLLLLLFAFRMWIGVALGIVGYIGLCLVNDPETAGIFAATVMKNSLTSFVISAIPIYILMGTIVAYGGAGSALFTGVSPLMERFLPGGLIHANLVACTLFGAVCGSSLGGSAAIGIVAIPEERTRGYNIPFAAASVAAGGPMSLMIPPSLAFILFGTITGTDISKLFVAGVLPGILLTILMMMAVVPTVRIWPHLTPARASGGQGMLFYVHPLVKTLPVVALGLFVLWAIWGGVATPTEVAAVGVLGAILMSIALGQLTWGKLVQALTESVNLSVMLLFLFLGAMVYSAALGKIGLIGLLREAVVGLPYSPFTIVMIIFGVYFIMGMFIDGMSIVVITSAVTFPIFTGIGYDPLWAGVMMVTVCSVASITPPVGLTLYVVQGIAKEDLLIISKWAIPFVIALCVGAVILTAFPIIATWLPSFMGR